MAHGDIKKSTRIERARQRLDSAVQRLEVALEHGGKISSLQQDVTALKSQNKALQSTTADVAAKLDQTIERLQATLEDR